MYHCDTDDDCVAVTRGCCGCSAMGSLMSINKAYKAVWNTHLDNICGMRMCPSAMSQDYSCFSEPGCVNSTCMMIPGEDYVCSSQYYDLCRDDPTDDFTAPFGMTCGDLLRMCG